MSKKFGKRLLIVKKSLSRLDGQQSEEVIGGGTNNTLYIPTCFSCGMISCIRPTCQATCRQTCRNTCDDYTCLPNCEPWTNGPNHC